MKKKNWYLLFLTSLSYLSCGFLGGKDNKDNVPDAKVIDAEVKPILTTKTIDTTFVLKTTQILVEDTISFVQVNGDKALKIYLGNIILDYFDQIMFNEISPSVFEYENRFYSLVERLKIQLNENLNENINIENQKWYGSYNSEVLSITPDFITLKLGYSHYYGGAHGMFGTRYRVFDRNKYELLDLKNTFKDLAGLKKVVEKNFEIYLKEKSLSWKDLLVGQDDFELTDNFYIKQDYLFFNYNVYEIAPYYFGEIEFGVPMQEIVPFLIKDITL